MWRVTSDSRRVWHPDGRYITVEIDDDAQREQYARALAAALNTLERESMFQVKQETREDTCDECQWWTRLYVQTYAGMRTERAPTSYGTCKRMPPAPMEHGNTKWPETPAGEWCGEFKRRANEAAAPQA